MKMPANLANLLTLFRVVVLIPYAALFYVDHVYARLALVTIFVLASLTDWLDGYVARRFDQYSDFGRFLDPIADKLLVVLSFAFLLAAQTISGFHIIAVVIIFLREIFISGLREFLGAKNITVHVTKLAKWKTASQMIALFLWLLIFPATEIDLLEKLALFMLWLSAALTFWTGYDYWRQSKKYFQETV